MTLDGLADLTSKMAEEAFEMSGNMRPKWRRWVIPQEKIKGEIIEANMILRSHRKIFSLSQK